MAVFSPTTYDWWKAQWNHQVHPDKYPKPELEVGVAYPGIYRWSTKKGTVPVRVWISSAGDALSQIGSNGPAKYADAEFCENVFSWCCRNAILQRQLEDFLLKGHWHDEPAPYQAPAGSNLPENFVEAMRQRLAGEKDEIEQFLKQPLDTQEKVDRAANWAARLIQEIRDPVEQTRVREKEPHLSEARAVDETYAPIRDLAASLSRRLKEAQEGFLKAQKARLLEQRGPVEQIDLEPGQRRPYQEKINAKAGTIGSRTALRVVRTAMVENRHVFAEWLIETNHPDYIVCEQNIANKLARAKATAPGMTILEEMKAR